MEGPSTSHAAICTHVHRKHLGGIGMSSCAKLSSTHTPSSVTRKVILHSNFW